jgi:hypothetical protein
VNDWEVGCEGEQSLEGLELYADTLRHAVVRCLDHDGQDRTEGDGTQGDEALEGAEGNDEDGTK